VNWWKDNQEWTAIPMLAGVRTQRAPLQRSRYVNDGTNALLCFVHAMGTGSGLVADQALVPGNHSFPVDNVPGMILRPPPMRPRRPAHVYRTWTWEAQARRSALHTTSACTRRYALVQLFDERQSITSIRK